MTLEQNFLFSVVTPTYNAEPWIDAFFQSVVKQSLDFKKHIQIIIADDGSTDNSPAMAQKWAAEYPENIVYARKENGGLSSARNFGLEYATGNWVTFIDPDDFVCETYFDTVKEFIEKSNFDGHAIACNLIVYDEKSNDFIDSHLLNFKFKSSDKIIDLIEQPEFIQLSVASCFLRMSALKASGLKFDERVKPSFEDAHLLNRFFISSNNFKIAYLKDALYFYRKRILADGLVASGWRNSEKFKEQIFYGYLNLVQYAKQNRNDLPDFIQNIIIYDMQWYMNRMLENRIPYEFSEEEFSSFLDLTRMLFKHIESEKIFFSNLPMLNLRTRIAMLNTFKDIDLSESPAYVYEVAPDRSSLLLVHYSAKKQNYTAFQGNKEIAPLWEKTVNHKFCGAELCVEQYCWLPLSESAPLSFKVNGKPVTILSGGTALDEATTSDIINSYYMPESMLPEKIQNIRLKAKELDAAAKYKDCWLFSDRVDMADDNAEHLYRWMTEQADLTHKIYFVLKKSSPDWIRLEREGFKLIANGSEEHHIALFNAEWVLSSHLHPPIRDPLGIRIATGLPAYKYAFLQHGITLHDISQWINSMKIDLFVSSTLKEYNSILNGSYKITQRELVLSGFPRHDALLKKKRSTTQSKLILLCPTWRDHLCNQHTYAKASKAEANAFMQSDYFKEWNALTSNEELAVVAKEYGYRFIFLPHPHTSRMVDLFTYSDRVICKKYSEIRSVQDLLSSCSLLITEYSSMAMEAAYAGTPVLYYQFSEEPSFFSMHTLVKGYFEYERDGFGPVVNNITSLVNTLKDFMIKGGKREDLYEKRANEFFTLRDGNNCLRTYQAILDRSIKTSHKSI